MNPVVLNEHPDKLTSYDIEMLGQLWMPQTDAAMDYHISHDKIVRTDDPIVPYGSLWLPSYEDELEAIDRWLTTNTGDFSAIVGTRITKNELISEPERELEEGWKSFTKYTRSTVIRDFEDDQEDRYMQCMFGDDHM